MSALQKVEEVSGKEVQHLYRHYDDNNNLLYVGVSLSAIQRLGQHRDNSRWFNEIASVKIEKFPSREAVLEAEKKAIQTENPKHNLQRYDSKKHYKQTSASNKRTKKSIDDLETRILSIEVAYTIQEISSLLKVSEGVVKQLMDSGELSCIQIGKYRRVSGWQLLDFIENKHEPIDP